MCHAHRPPLPTPPTHPSFLPPCPPSVFAGANFPKTAAESLQFGAALGGVSFARFADHVPPRAPLPTPTPPPPSPTPGPTAMPMPSPTPYPALTPPAGSKAAASKAAAAAKDAVADAAEGVAAAVDAKVALLKREGGGKLEKKLGLQVRASRGGPLPTLTPMPMPMPMGR